MLLLICYINSFGKQREKRLERTFLEFYFVLFSKILFSERIFCFVIFSLQHSNSQLVLLAVCMLASICSTLGMRTVYYRDGTVCEACAEEYNNIPYRQTYYPSSRVAYEERVVTRPSSSYISNRDDSGSYYSNV